MSLVSLRPAWCALPVTCWLAACAAHAPVTPPVDARDPQTALANAAHATNQTGMTIEVTAVRTEQTSLVLELRHVDSSHAEPPTTPRLVWLVDGCPHASPPYRGELTFNGRGELVIDLSQLPEGDLQLEIQAFYTAGSVILRSDHGVVQRIRHDQMKSYRSTESTGSEPGTSEMDVSCPESAGGGDSG